METIKRRALNTAEPRPGSYLGVPFEKYAAAEALNNSRLKNILVSPAHFALNRRIESAAFTMGRLTHELVLTPRQFKKNWAVWEGPVRRGKAWDEFQIAHTGKDICTLKEWEEAEALKTAVMKHAIGQEYLGGKGHSEVTMIWQEEIDGMPLTLKCRIDRMPGFGGIADLKTTTADSKEAFCREAQKYQYEMQVAFYMRGYEACTGIQLAPHEFVFVVIEKATRIVTGYHLPDDAVHAGRQKVDHALRRYVECSLKKHWPAPNQGRVEELSNYFPRDFEGANALDFGGMAVEPMEGIAA